MTHKSSFAAAAVLFLGFASAASAAGPDKVQAPLGDRAPAAPPIAAPKFPTPAAAGWACRGGICSYQKVSGAWSNCFVSWSPTHGGWLPTRYCN